MKGVAESSTSIRERERVLTGNSNPGQAQSNLLQLRLRHEDASNRTQLQFTANLLNLEGAAREMPATEAAPQWLELLNEPDARVRANSVSAFWGQRDRESIQLFRQASLDPNHRVAANALKGLYQAGEISAVRGILKLVRDPDPTRQLAGVWILGETADPRFEAVVQENLTTKTGRLKFSLLNAARKIQKHLEELKQLPALQMSLVHFERAEKGRIRCSFQLRHADGKLFGAEELNATQVLIHDGDLRVDQFHFESREGGAIGKGQFVIPDSTREADLSAIEWTQLQWSTATYSSQLGSLLHTIEAAVAGLGPLRHIAVVLDSETVETTRVPAHWPELFAQHQVTFHAILLSQQRPEAAHDWKHFCLDRKGTFSSVASIPQLTTTVNRLANAMTLHFYVTYQLGRSMVNPEEPEMVSIEVTPPTGYARLVIHGNGEPIAEG
jgi:hypothetical protein